MAVNNPLIGKQIGNYRILAEINSGSFGRVYQGKHIIFEDDPVVAIKLLHTTLRSQQEYTAFIKEAQVLKKLQHPHILRILDAGLQDGVPYLVTEYAAGGSLRDRLKQANGKPLPLDETTNILTQIGQALYYVHERHIIHRDLKPENVLFNRAGEALLADFGIAVLLASTRTGLVGIGGTPPYMAPEQFEGLASARSDQYSLGCIAYELVTGHRLFVIPNPTLEAYWFHQAKVEPVPPTHFHPQLPEHVEQAILTALAKDRTQRHKDVPTFSNALLKSSREWMNDGNNHYAAKRYEEALTSYDQAIRLDPDLATAYRDKGAAFNSLKRYEEALAACEQAIRLDPNNAKAYHHKGEALYSLKHFEEAIAAFDQAIRLDPNFAEAFSDKGYTLDGLKCYGEAIAAFDQAIRLDPKYTFAYNGKGNTLYSLERYEEAVAAFDQAIRLNPALAIPYVGKGSTFDSLGRYEEAIAAYDQAIRLDPNNVNYYKHKSFALYRLGRYEEAIAAYDQVIRLNPNDAEYYFIKGLTLDRLKHYEEAIAAYDQAIHLNPNDAECYKYKSYTLKNLGRGAEARAAFKQAIRLNPNIDIDDTIKLINYLNLDRGESLF